jgi:hypothetical protein
MAETKLIDTHSNATCESKGCGTVQHLTLHLTPAKCPPPLWVVRGIADSALVEHEHHPLLVLPGWAETHLRTTTKTYVSSILEEIDISNPKVEKLSSDACVLRPLKVCRRDVLLWNKVPAEMVGKQQVPGLIPTRRTKEGKQEIGREGPNITRKIRAWARLQVFNKAVRTPFCGGDGGTAPSGWRNNPGRLGSWLARGEACRQAIDGIWGSILSTGKTRICNIRGRAGSRSWAARWGISCIICGGQLWGVA